MENNNEISGKPEINTLVHFQEWPAISIYMPVSRIGDPQDSLRYKNFVTQVETRLIDEGMRTTEARSLLEPEYDLAYDTAYWKHLGADGLAVFGSSRSFFRYPLPVSFRERVTVGQRYHIRPLIPLLTDGRYLVLALSRKQLRLFQGDRYRLEEIELPGGTPENMSEALQLDMEQQLQYHAGSAPGGPSGRKAAIFHGHGGGADEQDEYIQRYFQIIDRALFPLLEDPECPVILAGTEESQASYKLITRSQTILPQGIAGSIGELSAEILHSKAWGIAEEYYLQAERSAVKGLQNSLGGDKVVSDLQSVLTAAFDGRVENLFVAEDEQVWGFFDPDKRQAVVKDKNNGKVFELLDEAVFWTLSKKGTVYVRKRQDMPLDTLICARVRF